MKNVSIIGANYQGIINALILNPELNLIVRDLDINKITQIKDQENPEINSELYSELENRAIQFEVLDLAQLDWLKDTDVLIYTVDSSNFTNTNNLDTSDLDNLLKLVVQENPTIKVILHNLVPIQYCDKLVEQYGLQIMYIPEYLSSIKSYQELKDKKQWIIGRSTSIKIEEVQELCELLYGSKKFQIISNRAAITYKLAYSSFIALHIAFTNEINELCHAADLDFQTLIDQLKTNTNAIFKHMQPSPGFGGNTIPRDVKCLASQYNELVPKWMPRYSKPKGVLSAIVENNLTTTGCAYSWITDILEKYPDTKTIGVLGLSYKEGSSTVKESRFFDLVEAIEAEAMLGSDFDQILVYDEYLIDKLRTDNTIIEQCDSAYQVLQKADILIINHPKYAELLEDATAKAIIDFSGVVKAEPRKDLYSWKA